MPSTIAVKPSALALVADALAAIGQRAGERRAGRNDQNFGMQIKAELQRSRGDDGAVLGDKADAGASLRTGRPGQSRGNNSDQKRAKHHVSPVVAKEQPHS
jgi:hypothetical protein